MWLSVLVACSNPTPVVVETPPPVEVPATPPAAPPPAAPVDLAALRDAVAKNPKDANAAFALVIGLEDARAAHRACDDEAYLRTVVEQVAATVALDPSLKDKLKAEPKLAEARATLEFWQAVDGPLDEAGLAAHLPGTTLFPPAAGVYGDQSMAVLAANGKLTWRAMRDPDHPTEFHESPGTWSLKGRTIEVNPNPEETYHLTFDKDLNTDLGWSDFPSECEA